GVHRSPARWPTRSVDHPTIWRPTAAAPGGQERRCSPYESAIDSVSVPDAGRSASFRPPSAVCTEALTGGQREALTTLRSGARPLPRPADKSDVVRATYAVPMDVVWGAAFAGRRQDLRRL